MPTPRRQTRQRSRRSSTRTASSNASVVRPRLLSDMGEQIGQNAQTLAAELDRVTRELRSLAAYGKQRYDRLDRATKQRAKIALGVLAGLLATGVAVSAVRARPAGQRA